MWIPLRRRTHNVNTSELRITPLKKLRLSRANRGSTSVPWSLRDGIIFFAKSIVSKIGMILADGVRPTLWLPRTQHKFIAIINARLKHPSWRAHWGLNYDRARTLKGGQTRGFRTGHNGDPAGERHDPFAELMALRCQRGVLWVQDRRSRALPDGEWIPYRPLITKKSCPAARGRASGRRPLARPRAAARGRARPAAAAPRGRAGARARGRGAWSASAERASAERGARARSAKREARARSASRFAKREARARSAEAPAPKRLKRRQQLCCCALKRCCRWAA